MGRHTMDGRMWPAPWNLRPIVLLFDGWWTRIEWLSPPHPLAGYAGANRLTPIAAA
jgi:hypothetical protein